MEVLKLKIFDALTEKIAVYEFENWLYNSQEFMSQIDSVPFYFDVISINYRDEKWSDNLEKLFKEYYYYGDLQIIYKIEKSCLEISKSESPEMVYQILSSLLDDFDYQTDFDILWKFYSIKNCFECFDGSFFNKYELQKETKFYSKQVIGLIENCKDYKEIKQALELGLTPLQTREIKSEVSFKQKMFAFFKKI